MKIDVNGITINYDICGDGNWSTLVHGAGDNGGIWYNQLPALSGKYKTLTLDMRGHGASGVPDGPYDIDAYLSDLDALLIALKIDKTALLGHSLGGRVALAYTVRYPQRISALILSNTPVAMRDKGAAGQREGGQRPGPKPVTDMAAAIDRRISVFFSEGFAAANKDVMERYRQIDMSSSPEGYTKVTQSMRQAIAQQPSPDELASISCPTLIITGSADKVAGPQSAQHLAEAIPNTKLEVLPTGHYPALEKPDDFNAIVLKFMAEAAL